MAMRRETLDNGVQRGLKVSVVPLVSSLYLQNRVKLRRFTVTQHAGGISIANIF